MDPIENASFDVERWVGWRMDKPVHYLPTAIQMNFFVCLTFGCSLFVLESAGHFKAGGYNYQVTFKSIEFVKSYEQGKA